MISDEKAHFILDSRVPSVEDLELLMTNSAFLWGKSAFTTALLIGKSLSFYDFHFERLVDTSSWLWDKQVNDKVSHYWKNSWKKVKEQGLLDQNRMWRVRFTLFEDSQKEIHSILSLFPYKAGGASFVELELIPMPIIYQGRVENLKLGSYLDTFREQDKAAGIPLFFNEQGRVLETPSANIIFYHRESDKFIYPYEQGEMLLGIGLRRGLEGLNLEKAHLNKDDLQHFDSAFIINSLRGPQPVVSLNGRKLIVSDDLSEKVSSQFKRNIEKYSKEI